MSRSVAIVGGGISGLSTAYYLKQAQPDWQIFVFEKEGRIGGKIRTSFRKGFTFDWGPNGFLSSAPETLNLVRSLGLGNDLQAAADLAKNRYLYKDNGLRPLPANPPALLSSPLLSAMGKARAALEYVSGKANSEEESVFDFVKRHFGQELAELLAGPAVAGICAGDAQEISLDALLPNLRSLEQNYGSVLRGLQRQRKAQTAASRRLTSFRIGGMQTLIDGLEIALSHEIVTGIAVTALQPTPQGFSLSLSTDDTLDVDEVVLATPAYISSTLLEPFLPGAAELLRSIPYADVAVFGLGYDRIDVPHALDGFGFLVSRDEGLRSLGVLWSNALYPYQAPEGKVLLRVICGGSLDPEFAKLSDKDAINVVKDDLRISMGITAEPDFLDGVKWAKGIPQYLLGHRKKVQTLMKAVTTQAGLYLTGNAYFGVGVNDCVRDAERVIKLLLGEDPQVAKDAPLDPGMDTDTWLPPNQQV